jgi:membrane-associated phospholipid phosphatase
LEENAVDNLIQLFLPISIWFQNSPDWLATIMRGITFLGNTEFYLLVMPLLYWCLDTALGIRIGIILLVSGGLNSILKFGFQSPRPYWVSSEVDALTHEISFGFPSGHSQNGASIWGLFAASINKAWLKAVAVSLIILIGLSRIILGVHFTHDVLGGWLAGLILLGLFIWLEDPISSWFKRNPVSLQILALLIATSIFIVPALLLVNPLQPPALPSLWIEQGGAEISPYSYDGLLTTAGSFMGLGLGVILLNQIGKFDARAAVWKLIVRYLIGLAGVLFLYLGLDSLFPEGISAVAYTLRFVRYALIGFWISYGAPQVFIWLKLAERL